MNRSYVTEYPNQVHQFNIGFSKSFSVSSNRKLKFHYTSLRPRPEDMLSTHHHYVLFYLVRDHFSGLFFTEAYTAGENPNPVTFLAKAWKLKPKLRFSGIPDLLIIPHTTEKLYPNTIASISAMGIKTMLPTSGFQGGVRDLRTAEDFIRTGSGGPISNLSALIELQMLSLEQYSSHVPNRTKAELWDQYLRPQRFPETTEAG